VLLESRHEGQLPIFRPRKRRQSDGGDCDIISVRRVANRAHELVALHRLRALDTGSRLFLGSFVNFNEDSDDECLKAVLHGTQTDLHPSLGTVLATGDQSLAMSHGPRAMFIREAQTMANVG